MTTDTTATDTTAADETTAAETVPVAQVTLAGRGPVHELRAVRVVLQRDLTRFWLDRTRLIVSSFQPLLFLFVLGSGLAGPLGDRTAGVDYRTFLFPGVLVAGTMFTAVFSAISIVWDREFGFLREMLVAPVSRNSIVVGKCLGGAAIASLQGLLLLPLAGLVGIPYNPFLLLGCIGTISLISFSITAFVLVLAARITQVQTMMPVVQLLLVPLLFLSGALFPLSGELPGWLSVLTRVNPVSYGVDATRALVFHYLPSTGSGPAPAEGLAWWGWQIPPWLELTVVGGAGLVLLVVACALFSRVE